MLRACDFWLFKSNAFSHRSPGRHPNETRAETTAGRARRHSSAQITVYAYGVAPCCAFVLVAGEACERAGRVHPRPRGAHRAAADEPQRAASDRTSVGAHATTTRPSRRREDRRTTQARGAPQQQRSTSHRTGSRSYPRSYRAFAFLIVRPSLLLGSWGAVCTSHSYVTHATTPQPASGARENSEHT